MANLKWWAAAVWIGSVGCSGGTFSNVPDAGTPGPDGAVPPGVPPPSDGAAPSDGGPAGLDAPSDDGQTDAGCVTGSVTFDLKAAPGTIGGYCLGPPGHCYSEGWLVIRAATGSLGAFDTGSTSCETQCTDCQPVACTNLCVASPRLGDGGIETTWDGTYSVTSTCGAKVPCAKQACAPAGNYIARFCAYAEAPDASAFGCTGSSTPTCTETPFAWPPPPGAQAVQGILGGAVDSD